MDTNTSENLEILSFKESHDLEDEILFVKIEKEVEFLVDAINEDAKNAQSTGNKRLRYLLVTDISEQTKQYLIFLRNLYIEKLRAFSKYISDQISKEEFNQFKKNQIEEYRRVRLDYQEIISASLSSLQNENIAKHLDKSLSLILEPTKIYADQFLALKNQFRQLYIKEKELNKLVSTLGFLRETIGKHVSSEIAVCKGVHTTYTEMLSFLEQNKVASKELKEKLVKFKKLVDGLKEPIDFKDRLNDFISGLKDIEIIKSYQEGNILVKLIKVSSQLKNWLYLKTVPKLQKIRTDLYSDSLRQLRLVNSIVTSPSNSIENQVFTSDIFIDIEKQKQDSKENYDRCLLALNELKQDVQYHLTIDAVQNSENWNESLFSSTYSQVLSNTESVFSNFKELTGNVLKSIYQFFYRYGYNTPNLNEQIVNYLKNKSVGDSVEAYKKIFLDTERFQDYFIVDRSEEGIKMESAIDSWNKGFGNSMLVYGMQHCGKTSFVNSLINNKSFDQILFIKPSSSFIVEGRKFESDTDLEELLIEIKKNLSIHKKYCLILEDLELWNTGEISLISNANSLIKIIDRATSNLFFITTLNSRALDRLHTVMDFKSVFTWEIELSRIHVNEFTETVLNRHETAQREIKNIQGEPLLRGSLTKLAKRILKANGEIVGCSLSHWVGNIGDDGVVKNIKVGNLQFPFIVNDENIYLIDLLLVLKSVKQFDLLQLIPEAKRDIIRNQIGRFVKLNVILRDDDGYLSLSPLIIHHMYYQLSLDKTKKDTIHTYMLSSTVNADDDLTGLLLKLRLAFFTFPFKYNHSKVTIDKINDSIEIIIRSYEIPTQILKHLGQTVNNIQFEFKRNLL